MGIFWERSCPRCPAAMARLLVTYEPYVRNEAICAPTGSQVNSVHTVRTNRRQSGRWGHDDETKARPIDLAEERGATALHRNGRAGGPGADPEGRQKAR